jgi:ClpP class serine protease
MLYYHNILNGVWFIEPSFANNYIHYVTNWLKGVNNESNSKEQAKKTGLRIGIPENGSYVISPEGIDIDPEDAPANSIAILNINGVITKHDQFCGEVGMTTKADILQRCYNNANIKGVVIVGESGGGDGNAMRLMVSKIAERNKPVIGFVEDYSFSAMYGILAACDMIIANSEIAQVGSIGTYITLVDYSKQLEMEGISVKEIYATKSTDKNKIFNDAINGVPEGVIGVRAICDKFNEYFLQTVSDGRSDRLNAPEKDWGTGKTFFASEALKMGLIDGIDTIENVINYLNV